ncbi:MAG: DUF2480 family protein [Cyanothece sp. SIO1E1]|nr:DUF2480 family protein [Cyanothece sp. SIO1E1]
MSVDKPLVNKVAASGLITIKLEEFLPKESIVELDLKDYLFHGLILKEKDFRTALKEMDWSQFDGQVLTVYCSTDAIIPMWAYMLVATYATPHAHTVFQGTKDEFLRHALYQRLDKIDYEQYEDQRLVIKGCGDEPVPASAYLEITRRLQPIAKSIMYGEPCSTVPIYKQKRK